MNVAVCSIHREAEPCIFCRLDSLRRRRARGDASVKQEIDEVTEEILKRPIL